MTQQDPRRSSVSRLPRGHRSVSESELTRPPLGSDHSESESQVTAGPKAGAVDARQDECQHAPGRLTHAEPLPTCAR